MSKQGKTEWNSALNEIEMLSNIKNEIINASISGDINYWIKLIEAYLMAFGPYLKQPKGDEHCDPSKFNDELKHIKDLLTDSMPFGFRNIMQAPRAFQEDYRDSLNEAREKMISLTRRINITTKEAGLGIPVEEIKELREKLLEAYKND